MNRERLIKKWEQFAEKNDFKLNPDQTQVTLVAKGVLENEKEYGLKLCPCQLRDGTKQRDLELICPCNFKMHETWSNPRRGEVPRCWCGLFVKR